MEQENGKKGLGTLEGVFTPTILTILGVVMYLRLGWVVGNVGLSTIAGRLLGSVPANVARRSKIDVLIVHTTG